VCVCGTQERPSQNEGVLASTSMSRTTKSMGIKKFRILTGTFSAIPVGKQTVWSASFKHIAVGASS
jgi:hypothetical protein